MSQTTTHDSDRRSETLDVDLFYRALANHRRRIAIRALDGEGSVPLERLVADIAKRDGGDGDREEIRIGLVHQHLPMMADAGIVEYDEQNRRVTLRTIVEDFLPPSGLPVQ